MGSTRKNALYRLPDFPSGDAKDSIVNLVQIGSGGNGGAAVTQVVCSRTLCEPLDGPTENGATETTENRPTPGPQLQAISWVN
jgi:hypothetical protein